MQAISGRRYGWAIQTEQPEEQELFRKFEEDLSFLRDEGAVVYGGPGPQTPTRRGKARDRRREGREEVRAYLTRRAVLGPAVSTAGP